MWGQQAAGCDGAPANPPAGCDGVNGGSLSLHRARSQSSTFDGDFSDGLARVPSEIGRFGY